MIKESAFLDDDFSTQQFMNTQNTQQSNTQLVKQEFVTTYLTLPLAKLATIAANFTGYHRSNKLNCHHG